MARFKPLARMLASFLLSFAPPSSRSSHHYAFQLTARRTLVRTLMNAHSIGWGIVGCGDVCQVKSGPAFYKSSNSSLVAIMRRNHEKAIEYCKLHGIPNCHKTYEQVIDDPFVAAIYVATPPGVDRVRLAKMIARAGKPCIMEKPLARDAKEASEIVKIFQDAKLPLFCAYYRRYMPKFVKAKEAVESIGQITSVSVTLLQPRHEEDKTHWHYNRPVSGGGLLLDVGCHMLDLVDFIVGPIEDCQGIAVQSIKTGGLGIEDDSFPVEDNVRGIWKHSLNRRRVLGSCEFNFASSTSKDEIKIIGMNGAIAFSCFDDKPVRVTTRKGEETLLDSEHPEHVHQPLVQAIVNALLSKGDDESKSPHVLCSGETALRTSQVMDRLLNDRSSWDAAYL